MRLAPARLDMLDWVSYSSSRNFIFFSLSSLSTTTLPTMSSSPSMFSGDFDSETSDLYMSRSGLRDSGPFSYPDSGLSFSGGHNDFDRRFHSSNTGQFSRGQDGSRMFPASSMVCYPVSLGLCARYPKASGRPNLWRILFCPSVRPRINE